MIRFQCECGRQLQARDDQAGRTAACPSCGRTQPVPDPSTDIQVAEAVPVRGKRARPARDHDDRDVPDGAPANGKAVASLVLGCLSFVLTVLTGIPAVILGMHALRDIKRSRGRQGGQGLAVAGIATGIAGSVVVLLGATAYLVLHQAVGRVAEARDKTMSANNLKQLALGMHMFHDTYNRLPSSQTTFLSPDKKTAASWRLCMCPFIESEHLYLQYNWNEPWDGPTNRRLLAQVPNPFLLPGQDPDGSGATFYQVLVGPGTAFEKPGDGYRFAEFPDGTANTILIVEAATSVPWTKPEDLAYDPQKPLPRFGGHFRDGFQAAFADGSVRWVPNNTPQTILRAWVTRNGGEVVPRP
jgi:hypothetical protein